MTLKQFTAVLLLSIWLPTAWEFLASETTCVCGQDFQTAKQANWHQWRGPDATGVASTATPPIRWNDQSNIRWKFPIVGEGSSTPIVWKNQVFILSAVETNRRGARSAPLHPEAKTTPSNQIFEFVVWSLDRRNGDVLWKRVVAESVPFEGRHPSTTYAAASPTTDGKRLYVSFGSYGIFCLSLQGDLIWKKDLGQMRTRRGWGEAVSPVYHNGKLAIMWDQEDQSEIFVLESNNGNIIWKNRRDEPTTWATPLIAPIDGKTQLITNGTNAVRSYDFETGDIIWETTGTTLNAIPCPVRYQDHVICMGGYQGNDAFSIDLRAKGKINDSLIGPRQAIKWRIQRHTPYVPSPLITGHRIYFTKSLNAILNCFNAESGEPIFKNEEGYPLPIRLPQLKQMYGSPVATKDFIFLTSREGTTLVIKNTARFEIVSTNSLTEEIDASPAIVGNQIFLRGKRNLYCIENASQK
ncbi:PQQ-like beta-propeller repeat protein [Mariniblastus sp.]|nr:PQQ-like beta-propeller repeat protein [Mariniblastus sp.]MDA7909030.1 PQQ-like beta-propeller repeat protein [bacterium]MDA7906467.1 PQQ-like beta-propeller repeat protein [Mariniblastus sp.]MDA7925461.1 PQQ-like beta-propeller repeat protein [Mariniblastus sp.]MDA7928738.1 PQQ-like beta-propeller repeat protein [Mariniblastus sp.]